MPPAADERALALARQLEHEDGSVGVALERVRGLEADVGALARRADELASFFARLPGERAARAEATGEAVLAAALRGEELLRAETELGEAEQAGDDERLAAARRAVVAARDRASMAEKRAAAARSAGVRLEEEARAGELEAEELDRRGRSLAEALRELPRTSAHAGAAPAPGLEALAAWASGARAALFVVRGGLEREREALVRQANELESAVRGAAVAATSVSAVRQRLERARDDD